MAKASFEDVNHEIDKLDVSFLFTDSINPEGETRYSEECRRVCESLGWTLDEYDTELGLRVLGAERDDT